MRKVLLVTCSAALALSMLAACSTTTPPSKPSDPMDCSKPENKGNPYCQPANDGASPASAPLKKPAKK